jgi:pimeloyl-ACP methyl ester carboxylesterase
MPVVSVNGVELHYREVGEGPPLVWVMGTGMNGDAWHRYQVPEFASRYRCLTFDLRGSGRSACPDTPYSAAVLAEDLAGLLDHLGVDAASLVGFSLGAATVQELALSHPERVRSAVLMSTWSSSALEHHVRRHYESRIYALSHADLEVFKKFAFWMWAPSTVDERYDDLLELEAFLGTVSGASDVSGYIGHFAADLAHETLGRLPRITCPVLVVHGDEDLITRPAYNQRVADAIPGARRVEIARAGHLAFLEQPEAMNTAIGEFLQETRPDRS